MSGAKSSVLAKVLSTGVFWPLIVTVPIVLTYRDNYKLVFPENWYDSTEKDYWNDAQGLRPSALGLSLGLLAVVIGQIFTLLYFTVWKHGYLGSLTPIQKVGAPMYGFREALWAHLAQPEGFFMLGSYLILTWMLGLMPKTYYSFSGGINWSHVLVQLLAQDAIQYVMHLLEHNLHAVIYQHSHKPHHRFTNPKLFDAFNGSPADTFLMILVPLVLTARIVPANVWSYMAFGSLYANWLTLIHAEYVHPWDNAFRVIGFGTAADHHVHHKLFKYNFGHLFM